MVDVQVKWEVLGVESLDSVEESLGITGPLENESVLIVGFEEFAQSVLVAGADAISFEVVPEAEANKHFLESFTAFLRAAGDNSVLYEEREGSTDDEGKKEDEGLMVLVIVVFGPLIPNNEVSFAIIKAANSGLWSLWEKLGLEIRPSLSFCNTFRRSFAEWGAEMQSERQASGEPLVIATKQTET